MNDTTQGEGYNNIQPLTIKQLEAICRGYKTVKPVKYIYMNLNTFNNVLDSLGQKRVTNPFPTDFGGVMVIQDNEVGDNEFFYCEHRLFEIWKQLKNHRWIDKNDPKIDICKIAAVLYDNELKDAKKSSFECDFMLIPSGHYLDPDHVTPGDILGGIEEMQKRFNIK